jgi:hypothetical protein
MSEQRRRGRPQKAAQSRDEALDAVYAGTAPNRPRNGHEREAQRRRPGRRPQPNCATRAAAALAAYNVKVHGQTLTRAARTAAADWKVNADNVRRYARRLLSGPTVTIKSKRPSSVWDQWRAPEVKPLLARVEHVEPVEGIACPPTTDGAI